MPTTTDKKKKKTPQPRRRIVPQEPGTQRPPFMRPGATPAPAPAPVPGPGMMNRVGSGVRGLGRLAGPLATGVVIGDVGQNILDQSLPTQEENVGMAESLKRFLGIEDLFTPENIARRDTAAFAQGAGVRDRGSMTDENEDMRIARLNAQLDPADERAVIAQRAEQSTPVIQQGIDPALQEELNARFANINVRAPEIPRATPSGLASLNLNEGNPEFTSGVESFLSQNQLEEPRVQSQPQQQQQRRRPFLGRALDTIGNKLGAASAEILGRPSPEERGVGLDLQEEALRRSQQTLDPTTDLLLRHTLGERSAENAFSRGQAGTREQQIMQFLIESGLLGQRQSFEGGQGDLDRQNRLDVARTANPFAGMTIEELMMLTQRMSGRGAPSSGGEIVPRPPQ